MKYFKSKKKINVINFYVGYVDNFTSNILLYHFTAGKKL
jgi:hypothetical protein